jgi:23S rRNA pseudouridine2605 synthase
MAERVHKILSRLGIASRRQAEKMILAGRVRLNGSVVHLGQTADSNQDLLEIDGKAIPLDLRPRLVYLLLNKPAGVICTCHDPQDRTTVLDLLPDRLKQGQGIHPVGRLDVESTGALILTNDGALTLRLTHPRYHLPKTYRVWIEGNPPNAKLDLWRNGLILSGKKTLPAKIKVLQRKEEETLLEVVLNEGRNRQIRRVAEELGYQVKALRRTAIGPICLQEPQKPRLALGKFRFLTNLEISFLTNLTNLANENESAPSRSIYEGASH